MPTTVAACMIIEYTLRPWMYQAENMWSMMCGAQIVELETMNVHCVHLVHCVHFVHSS